MFPKSPGNTHGFNLKRILVLYSGKVKKVSIKVRLTNMDEPITIDILDLINGEQDQIEKLHHAQGNSVTVRFPPQSLPRNPTVPEAWTEKLNTFNSVLESIGLETINEARRICDVCSVDLPLTIAGTDFTCQCGFISDICHTCQKSLLEHASPECQQRIYQRTLVSCPGSVGCRDEKVVECLRREEVSRAQEAHT